MSDGTDEKRPPEDDAPRDESAGAGEGAPPPSTWAGRKRAEKGDAGETAEEAGRDEADIEPTGGRGMTEEFEGLEAELVAELDELGVEPGEDEPAAGPSPADEQVEPPDEFEFEEEAEADDDEAEAEGEQAEAEPAEAGSQPASDTVEIDTLSAGDGEQATEAAHAGLKARAAKSALQRGVEPVAPSAAAGVAGAVAPSTQAGEPPKRSLWLRFLAASLVIIASMASATSVSFLLFLSDIAEGLSDEDEFAALQGSLATVEGGEPQTILVIGSDTRTGTSGDPGRSDTMMLMRVDPDQGYIALLSLPRDLKVSIPGYGTDKLNASYSYGEQYGGKGGGPELVLETVKELFDIEINHIVNVDFEGFYEAINAIDCVYIDVDRHYYHSNVGLAPSEYYDEIDIPAGYSKLCGFRGLDYARYRHNDNDIVRGARQQEFVREARQRIPPRELLPYIGGSRELIDIFTEHTTSDINRVAEIIDMLETFVAVRRSPVVQIEFPYVEEGAYVVVSRQQVDSLVDQFLGVTLPVTAEEPTPDAGRKDRRDKGKRKDKGTAVEDPALIDVSGLALEHATEFDGFLRRRKARLPVYFPTAVAANASSTISDESRAFAVEAPDGDETKAYYGYKFVVPFQESGFTSYYGVSGLNWHDPPILENASETRTIDGRDYSLFFDGDRLRLAGWKTDQGSYWVINTLTRALSEDEMLGIATSLAEHKR